MVCKVLISASKQCLIISSFGTHLPQNYLLLLSRNGNQQVSVPVCVRHNYLRPCSVCSVHAPDLSPPPKADAMARRLAHNHRLRKYGSSSTREQVLIRPVSFHGSSCRPLPMCVVVGSTYRTLTISKGYNTDSAITITSKDRMCSIIFSSFFSSEK